MLTFLGSMFGGMFLVALRVLGGWCYDEEKIPRELWRRVRPVLESLLVSMAVVFCIVTFGFMHVRGRIAAPYFEYMALHGSLIIGYVAYRIAMPIMTRSAERDINVPLGRIDAAEEQGVRWIAHADQLTMKYRERQKKPGE